MLLILLRFNLLRTNYYLWLISATSAPLDEDASDEQLFVGALLLRNLQVVQFNGHEVSRFSQLGT